MNISFKPSFIKDFEKLPFTTRREVRSLCVEIFPKIRTLRDLRGYDTKPIKGFKENYQVRLEDYQIGFKIAKNNTIEFMGAKHRKDIYKHFP